METFQEYQKKLKHAQIEFDQLAQWYYNLIEKYDILQQLSEVHNEYIQLLTDEITELAEIAVPQGWYSSRVEQGEKFRNKIQELKNQL